VTANRHDDAHRDQTRSPRLIARAGPLEGTSIALVEDETTIGRDKDCTLPMESDTLLSRRHCAVVRQGNVFTIRDLGSYNGTYVNDVAVEDRRLEHGDEIRIGSSVFQFDADEDAALLDAARVQLEEGEWLSTPAIAVPRSGIQHLNPDALLQTIAAPRPRGRPPSRMVKAILDVCRAVSSTTRIDQLQQQLLGAVLDAVPARRAAILLVERDGGDFTSARHRAREGGEEPFRIPRAVVERVVDERVALCVNDAPRSDALSASRTIQQAMIRSIAAVPIVAGEVLQGVIYADASDPAVRFAEEDVELLMGVAELAAKPLAAAVRAARLEREHERLLNELAGRSPLIGGSDRMRAVHRFIMKVGASDSTVLVSGPSGTGKELVARAIHRASRRFGRPFVAINCAAVADTLLESEFFGHEKGAFTGAIAQKRGKLEEADGGTIFLDEIGELALPLQAKLLRVLQEREFERVGGTRPVKVDIRVIAATNRQLDQESQRGTFRQDLYFRLNVVSDIPPLAHHFVEKHAKASRRRVTGVSDAAMSRLMAYEWPGNVRELENAIERAIVLGTTEEILPDDLPEALLEVPGAASPGDSATDYHHAVNELKRRLILRAMEHANGNYTAAAKLLALHPNYLHRLITNMQLRPLIRRD
jgi:transcriptional regulator with GAF, ATPase, and Fis domain